MSIHVAKKMKKNPYKIMKNATKAHNIGTLPYFISMCKSLYNTKRGMMVTIIV